MKPVLAFVLAFVIGTAASTGAKLAITKPAKTSADSTHADSSKAGGVESDSAQATDSTKSATDTAIVASGQPATPPVEAAPTPDTVAKPAAKPAAAKEPDRAAQLETAVAKATAAAAAADTAVQASEKRIAKVFTSMDAKQAAKVLEHMADNDVHVILGYVGVKQAAQIMAALPPERVAKLSKLAMGSR
jgi:flagellar motility protein MotE (MotC chaperone)